MADIYQLLEKLNIAYKKVEHPPVFTVEEADAQYHGLEGGQTKNLFLRNKKGTRHYLLVAESNRPIDLKEVRSLVDESTLSFASPERLMKYLGLTPGSVSPFGIINDTSREVVVLLDAAMLRHDLLNYHPNINTATLTLRREDFLRFLEHCGNEVRILELPA